MIGAPGFEDRGGCAGGIPKTGFWADLVGRKGAYPQGDRLAGKLSKSVVFSEIGKKSEFQAVGGRLGPRFWGAQTGCFRLNAANSDWIRVCGVFIVRV